MMHNEEELHMYEVESGDEDQQEEEQSIQIKQPPQDEQDQQMVDDDDNEDMAQPVKGTYTPEVLIERILRNKIISAPYYKLHCFGLTAETLIDKCDATIKYIGGTYGGNRKPTEFMCMLYKLLIIQPEPEIIQAYIYNEHYKYLTILGALYLRLTAKSVDVYTTLEPLLNDYRKIVRRNVTGKYEITHVDEIIDELLTSSYAFDISLPLLPKRKLLEDQKLLEPRISELQEEFEEEEKLREEVKKKEEKREAQYKLKLKSSESKKRKYDQYAEESSSGGGNEISLSIDQTNELRKKLGLKPLRVTTSDYERERRHQSSSGSSQSSNQKEISLSIDESNDLRKRLGLKPLRVSASDYARERSRFK